MENGNPLRIDDPPTMNLLGLMLGGILERNLARDQGRGLASKLKGSVDVTAGKMKVTIRFDRGPVTVTMKDEGRPNASVKGSLDGLLQVSLGRGAVRSFLTGDVSFSGSPLFLLKMMPLIRVHGRPSR